ncbi:hypothetical protein V1517DRAFT_97669 [Lipomyces orientalis]|uniref:Uncharacterized protein n=1 Tax=Lipomyces orientalis TaxID=1233043 RepID=A0ACC3TQC4_9ASCO
MQCINNFPLAKCTPYFVEKLAILNQSCQRDGRAHQVVEDGYDFFSKRQLVTLFSAPNYCGEFDNAGAMMSVDESLLCSFQIVKPAEKKAKNGQASVGGATPPRNKKNGGK